MHLGHESRERRPHPHRPSFVLRSLTVAIHIPPAPTDTELSPLLPDRTWDRSSVGSTGGQWRSLVESVPSLIRHKAPILWMIGFGIGAAMIFCALQPQMYR